MTVGKMLTNTFSQKRHAKEGKEARDVILLSGFPFHALLTASSQISKIWQGCHAVLNIKSMPGPCIRRAERAGHTRRCSSPVHVSCRPSSCLCKCCQQGSCRFPPRQTCHPGSRQYTGRRLASASCPGPHALQLTRALHGPLLQQLRTSPCLPWHQLHMIQSRSPRSGTGSRLCCPAAFRSHPACLWTACQMSAM